jgi:alpha-L-fucosidase
VIGVGPDAPVRLMAGARFEHCSVVSTEPSTTAPLVDVRGDGAAIVGCAIHGSLEIHGSHARLVSITTRAIHGEHADHVSVVRSTIVDPVDDGPAGIVVDGGAGHLVDSCLIGTTRIGIRIANAVGTVVRGNRIRASWTGVRVDSCQDTAVLANSFERVARAIDVVGGSDAEVSGNLATTGDSGAVVRDGATACTVAGNRWERTRIGLLAWDVGVVHHRDNDCIDLGDPDGAVVTGP